MTTRKPSTKSEVGFYANPMNKLKTKADVANKTPSEVVAEVLRK